MSQIMGTNGYIKGNDHTTKLLNSSRARKHLLEMVYSVFSLSPIGVVNMNPSVVNVVISCYTPQ